MMFQGYIGVFMIADNLEDTLVITLAHLDVNTSWQIRTGFWVKSDIVQ